MGSEIAVVLTAVIGAITGIGGLWLAKRSAEAKEVVERVAVKVDEREATVRDAEQRMAEWSDLVTRISADNDRLRAENDQLRARLDACLSKLRRGKP